MSLPTRPVDRTRRQLVRAAFGAALLGAGAPLRADTVVKLVVAYPPGGSNDAAARILAPALSAELGANVVIDNRPGANGTTGAGSVARAAPDGRTLLLVSASPLVVVPHVMKLGFDPMRELVPVNMVGYTPEALAVNPSVPARTLAELLELAKTRDIRLSSSGIGGLPHLTIEMLRAASDGSRILHVPYKGGGPATTDALGGHVDGIVMDLTALLPHIQAGRLRALAVTSAKRDESLPDVPTTAEQGLPKVEAVNWIGLFAPAGLPAAETARLHAIVARVVAQPGVAQQLRAAALMPQTQRSAAVFQSFVAAEHAKWGDVARRAELKSE